MSIADRVIRGWRRGPWLLARPGAAVWLGNFASVGLRFAQSVLIARSAGADVMGVYVAALAYVVVFSRLADLGLPNALAYFMRASSASSTRCVMICLGHAPVVFLTTATCFWAMSEFSLVPKGLEGSFDEAWLLLTALAAASFLSGVLSGMLIPLNAHHAYAVATVVSPVVMMAVYAATGLQAKVSLLVTSALIGEIAAAFTAAVMLWCITREIPRSLEMPSIRAIYGYGIKTHFGITMKVLTQRGDRIVLSWFVPPAALAAYSLATGLRELAMLATSTHGSLLRNSLIDEEGKPNGRSRATELLRRDVRRWFFVSGTIALILIVACPIVVPLVYGEEFADTVSLFMIIGASIPMLTVANLCWIGLLAANKPGLVSVGMSMSGVGTLGALYLGARLGDILSAAWAVVVVSTLMAMWWSFVSLRSRPHIEQA